LQAHSITEPGGGVRPIAIGEVFARILALCALQPNSHLGVDMCPHQVGVGIQGGAQCLGLAIRAGTLARPEDITLKLDWRNAFNSLSRQKMLDTVLQEAPSLYLYAYSMYSQPSKLWLSGSQTPLLSQAGVRQGDPCGPLLFCLALQPLLRQLACEFPTVRVHAYLDDTFLQGPALDVASAFARMQQLGESIKLQVREDKCSIYSSSASSLQAVSAALPQVPTTAEGILVAGCPVGSPAFVQSTAKGIADKIGELAARIITLDIPAQSRFLILSKSLQHKIRHLARCIPLADLYPHLQHSQWLIWLTFLKCIQRKAHEVDIDQIVLPLRLGGMGLSDLLAEDGVICKAAFISASAQTAVAFQDASPLMNPLEGPSGELITQYWNHLANWCSCGKAPCACGAHPRHLPALVCSGVDPPFPKQDLAYLSGLQRAVSEAVSLKSQLLLWKKHEDLATSSDEPSRLQALKDCARLRSVQHSVGHSCYSAMPTRASWRASDGAFKSSVRFRLGCNPGSLPSAIQVCACGKRSFDLHHALTCSQFSSKLRQLRHNHTSSLVQGGAKRAGLG